MSLDYQLFDIQQIAKICHETNRAYCETIGDITQPRWADANDDLRASAIRGVKFSLAHPDAPASAQHDEWLNGKIAAGWKFGPDKDAERREHPCIVAYDQLPLEQRMKDHLFRAIVDAFVKAYQTEHVAA